MLGGRRDRRSPAKSVICLFCLRFFVSFPADKNLSNIQLATSFRKHPTYQHHPATFGNIPATSKLHASNFPALLGNISATSQQHPSNIPATSQQHPATSSNIQQHPTTHSNIQQHPADMFLADVAGCCWTLPKSYGVMLRCCWGCCWDVAGILLG